METELHHLCVFVSVDLESKPAVGLVSTVSGSSFYMVRTEDGGTAVSAAGSVVTQPSSDEAPPSVAEAKMNGNESFYFIDDDKSIPASADNSEETAVSVPTAVPGDTEPEAEEHEQDEEMEDKSETAVKTSLVEASSPVPVTQPSSDPNSLLTSVRLVIGALNHVASCQLLVDN